MSLMSPKKVKKFGISQREVMIIRLIKLSLKLLPLLEINLPQLLMLVKCSRSSPVSMHFSQDQE